MTQPLLDVQNLHTAFFTRDGRVPAVDGVTFQVGRQETVGLVGESGCGKSVTALSVMRLISSPGRIEGGRMLFDGRDLACLPEAELRAIRGNQISMIFQEPMTSLNPVYTIGRQIQEAVELHQGIGLKEARLRTVDALRLVGIPAPESRLGSFPFQLSGGQRQRVMIAMALVCRPKLLIADEPTTALDVTIQAQILDLMRELKKSSGMSILLITHDLGVIAEMAERVIVMYAGRVAEEAPVRALFHAPLHPYTVGLLTSVPRMDTDRGRLHVIEGTVPRPTDFPAGCRFHPRCSRAFDRCRREDPPLFVPAGDRRVACWLHAGKEASR